MIQTVALLSVFGLGISFSILGALKLELTKVLNIDDAQFGKLIRPYRILFDHFKIAG